MSCSDCDNCEDFCTSEITCVDANFTNISVSADATLNDVLEAIDESLVSLKGDKGDTGDTGATGATGGRGNSGGNTLIFDSSIDPASPGGLSFDSSGISLAAVSIITLSHTSKADYTGTNSSTGNAASWEDTISVGDIIQVTSVTNPSHYGVYTVTAKTVHTNWNDYNVSLLTSNSTDPVGQFTVSFVKKGTAGTNGTNGVDAVSPVGAIQMFAGSSAPTGYLMCKGDIVAIADYSALHAVIGSTYNDGSVASGFFRLPNFQGRVPLGNGTSDAATDFTTLGQKGGYESHFIDINELPAHTHSITDVQHTHSIPANNGALTAGINPAQAAVSNAGTANPYLTPSSSYTGITGTNANSTTHNALSLMQSYLNVNFIIKY